jgi:hypothetical protein
MGRIWAVAGIDVGSQSTKVVILEGDRILAAVTLKTGELGKNEARQAMDEDLQQARLKLEDLKGAVSTGAGRMSVLFARKQRSSVSCLARGIPGHREPDAADSADGHGCRVLEDDACGEDRQQVRGVRPERLGLIRGRQERSQS